MHGKWWQDYDQGQFVGGSCKHKNGVGVLKTSTGISLAGSSASVSTDFKVDYVIDMNGHYPTSPSQTLSGTKKILSKLTKFLIKEEDFPEVLRVKCKDFSAPEVSHDMWIELLKILPKGAKVLCTCQGGHGRTGTALASILAADRYTASEAIEMVRKHYCKEAVETESQENYILGVYASRLFGQGKSKSEIEAEVKKDKQLIPKHKLSVSSSSHTKDGNNVKEFKWKSAYSPVCPNCLTPASVKFFAETDKKDVRVFIYSCQKCKKEEYCYRDHLGVSGVVKADKL